MIIKHWLLLTMAILAPVSCSNQQISRADIVKTYYFEETGHTVQGDFLRFFNLYGGTESLGYPLTEEIMVDGWTVQYFEKGRLERHPENEPAYRITIGWLGDLLHRRRSPIPITNIPRTGVSNQRYFPQTGHTVSGDFLHYFDTYGGSVQFGLPISEPFLLEGCLTQDFQSARFFWTPENESRVTLEEIGRVHFEASGLDRALLEAVGD